MSPPSPREVRGSFVLVALALGFTACVEQQQVLFSNQPDASTPDASTPGVVNASALSAGDQHACAIVDAGLYCWGANANGELGTGMLGDRAIATRVGTGTDWKQVSAGESSTCGLRGNGQVWCWGKNTVGEVGRGDFQVQLTPRQVSLALPATELSLYTHACVVLTDASLWCWGKNTEGEAGQNDPFPWSDLPTPTQVSAGVSWRTVASGQGHTCAIRTDGSLWCWGRNTGKQLGLGSGAAGQLRIPTQVGSDTDWRSLSCHQEGCCALKNDRSLWCWGASAEASLNTRVDDVPTRVGTDTDWAAADPETFFTCGLKLSGAVWCWGRNAEGQLGTSDRVDRYVPGPVGDGGARQVSTGRFFTCQRALDGTVKCNGKNEHGQAGADDFLDRYEATPVQFE